MKTTTSAMLAGLAGTIAALLTLPVARAAGPSPYDNSWTVTLSSYAPADSPTITAVVSVGGSGGTAAPPDTAFFDMAGTTFSGITPSSPATGAQIGTVGYDIQTNGSLLPNNIQPSGQAIECGAAGTTHITASNFPIYAAVKALASPTVDDTVIVNGYPQDQAPDLAAGGAPLGLTHVPVWYPSFMGALGIPDTVIISRGFGIGATGNAHTSANIMTINATQGRYVQLSLLGNPTLGFQAQNQTQTACPPFSSSVQLFGTAVAHDWLASGGQCTDYFGANIPSGCSGETNGTAGTLTRITGTAGNAYDFVIQLSSAPDTDSDIAANGNHLWADWDNCRVDPNPDQADSKQNGIGDACRSGGSWAGTPSPATLANAQMACDGSDVAHTAVEDGPPWAPCQDADQDGVLNRIDNCPPIPNADQADSDHDIIGDVCDPQPHIPGTGSGYGPPQPYFDAGDICNAPFIVGTGAGIGSCLNGGATHYADASSDGWPDFFNPGSNVCWQEHKADANNDGYSDSDEGSPWGGTISSCAGQTQGNDNAADFAGSPKGVFPAKSTIPAAAVLHDPLLACPGRAPVVNPDGSLSLSLAGKKARADVNLDGKVNLLDLGSAASGFGGGYLFPTNLRAEFDQNGDGKVNLLDLGAMASSFGQTVPAC